MKNNKIEAIVFDLAGTLIDFGSLAPSKVLIHIFNKIGIPISRKEAIGPMGIEKKVAEKKARKLAKNKVEPSTSSINI